MSGGVGADEEQVEYDQEPEGEDDPTDFVGCAGGVAAAANGAKHGEDLRRPGFAARPQRAACHGAGESLNAGRN